MERNFFGRARDPCLLQSVHTGSGTYATCSVYIGVSSPRRGGGQSGYGKKLSTLSESKVKNAWSYLHACVRFNNKVLKDSVTFKPLPILWYPEALYVYQVYLKWVTWFRS